MRRAIVFVCYVPGTGVNAVLTDHHSTHTRLAHTLRTNTIKYVRRCRHAHMNGKTAQTNMYTHPPPHTWAHTNNQLLLWFIVRLLLCSRIKCGWCCAVCGLCCACLNELGGCEVRLPQQLYAATGATMTLYYRFMIWVRMSRLFFCCWLVRF